MKLHAKLTCTEVYYALGRAKTAGKITPDVEFVVFGTYKSQTHPHAYEIQLGTYDKDSLPAGTRDQHGKLMRVRRFKNSGQHGADDIWAATYDEWGWFIAEIFKMDPHARFGPKPNPAKPWQGGYASPADFNRKTDNRFKEAM